MRRREFIAIIAGVAAAPLAARAQEGGNLRRVGILMGGGENDPEYQSRVSAFRFGLQELKWIDGSNIRFDIRWGAGDTTRTAAYATELVSLAPDVIMGSNTPTVRALKKATETIPIVFAGLADPIGDGIVASLSRPGGNITGFSSYNAPIASKWLQLLKDISPGLTRVGVIYNPDTSPYSIFLPELAAAASTAGVELIRNTVHSPATLETAMTTLAKEPGAGCVFLPDVFLVFNRRLIYDLAARYRLPSVYCAPFFAAEGGLIGYGPSFVDPFRQAASYVDRILRGAKPAELPVQAPTRLQLVINTKTAKSLGLTIPPALRDFADELVE